MKSLRFVGLDVHKDSMVVAVCDADGAQAKVFGSIANEFSALRKCLRALGPKHCLVIGYEAGPCGYGLQRRMAAEDFNCVVVAPSLVPKQAGKRIKTDRRDAAKLAHFLRSGDLTFVCVPDEQSEAIRDLVRAREDATKAQRTARHQLQKFLLRHDRRWSGKTSWTSKHLQWIAGQPFAHEAHKRVLLDYLRTVEQASERIKQLTADIAELIEAWQYGPVVQALQACRGVELITAVTVVAELGDMRRFEKAGQLMAYLGLVPSEHSSGGSRRQGRITKTGNAHVRRVLVEAAWCYRYPARLSQPIRKRNEGLSEEVKEIAWKAQQRLCRKLRRMVQRGKSPKVATVAVARELAGFLWAIANQPNLLAKGA